MAYLLVVGPNANHLTRMITPASMDPAAEALFPVTNLYDNRSSPPAMFSTSQLDQTITLDLSLVAGGSFEVVDDPASWTASAGTLTASTSDSFEGAKAGYLASSSDGFVYQDIDVRAGEELLFNGAVRNVGTEAYLEIRNRQTGRWLVGLDSSWSTARSYAVSATSGGWKSANSTIFSIESIETCLKDVVPLRLALRTVGGAAYLDGLELSPTVNWCSIHGHNIPPFLPPIVETSTDTSSWGTVTTMTLQRDSFYTTFTTQAARYWRVHFAEQPDTDAKLFLGELVLGQWQALLQNPSYGGTLKWNDRQTRPETDLGESLISLHNATPQRSLSLSFTFPTDAEYEQFHRDIFRGSRGGANVICIAPVEMDDEVVILGRIKESIDVVKNTPRERTSVLEIVESPLPNDSQMLAVYDPPPETGG
jgi:hypothetical protein